LPTPDQREVAALLLRKATSDLNAARTLAADPRQTDDVVGFHVQQSIEKAIKSSLATHVVEVPRTHRRRDGRRLGARVRRRLRRQTARGRAVA